MKTINEKFTDQEHTQLAKDKNALSKHIGKSLSWHDGIILAFKQAVKSLTNK